jgi:integrase/recombinase XerD
MTTLSTCLDEFLLDCKANGLSCSTVQWYSVIIKRMVGTLGDVPLTSVSRRAMREYIVSLRGATERYIDAPQKPVQAGSFASESIRSYITALHRFWAWSTDEYSLANPMTGIRRPKRQKPEPKAVDSADYRRLFDACGDNLSGVRNRAMLAVLADSGCRLGGLLSMDLEGLSLAKRRARVTEKGNKERTVYFTRYTTILLGLWIAQGGIRSGAIWRGIRKGEPLTVSGVHEALRRLKQSAKITGRVNPHSFRHRFAREYISNGGDISTLAKLLGHSDLSTTANYYAVFDEDELAEFHDKFTPMGKQP